MALMLRVILLLFGANPGTGFASFIYNLSADYMVPFRGIFPMQEVNDTNYLDVSAMFAILVNLFVLWGAEGLVNYVQNKIDLSIAIQQDQLEQYRQRKYEQQNGSTNSTVVETEVSTTTKRRR